MESGHIWFMGLLCLQNTKIKKLWNSSWLSRSALQQLLVLQSQWSEEESAVWLHKYFPPSSHFCGQLLGPFPKAAAVSLTWEKKKVSTSFTRDDMLLHKGFLINLGWFWFSCLYPLFLMGLLCISVQAVLAKQSRILSNIFKCPVDTCLHTVTDVQPQRDRKSLKLVSIHIEENELADQILFSLSGRDFQQEKLNPGLSCATLASGNCTASEISVSGVWHSWLKHSARGFGTAGQKIQSDVPLRRQWQAQQPALVSFAL